MKYEESVIVDIKNKIKKFLVERGFAKYEDIDQAFADSTRRSYYSQVEDQKGIKYFLKIRALDLDYDKKSFAKQRTLGEVLKTNPNLVLNNFTPKLIEGNNKDVDFLLYEYIEGVNLGSRNGYAVSKLRTDEAFQVVAIIKAILDFPVHLLPESFERRGKKYYQNFLVYADPVKTIDEKLGIDWNLFDENLKYLAHGDFKPANFLRTEKGLMILDFEQASISNKYADIVRIWAASLDVEFKNLLMQGFCRDVINHVSTGNLIDKDKLLHDMMLIHAIFERNYLKYKFTDVKDEFLELRGKEVEKILNVIASGTK